MSIEVYTSVYVRVCMSGGDFFLTRGFSSVGRARA